MSIQQKEQSLIFNFSLALGSIVLLAFISMLSSIFISESISGMASAINQSGSLRMKSFQIATDLVYTNTVESTKAESSISGDLFSSHLLGFDSRLHHQSIKSAIPRDPDSEIYKAYEEVARVWQYQVKPILYAYEKMEDPAAFPGTPHDAQWRALTETSRTLIRQRYLSLVNYFVAKINRMGKELELEMEHKIKILHLIETSSLFIAITIVLMIIFFLHSKVLTPLQSLMTATQKIRQGDFSYQAIVNGNNELTRLVNTFNAMSSELSKTYIDQEKEIREKTDDLKQKKDSMELLYNTSSILAQFPTSSSSYERILDNIKHFLNIELGMICLSGTNTDSGHILASNIQDQRCKTGCKTCITLLDNSSGELVIPIRDRNPSRSYGLLILKTGDISLDEWQTSTIQMISEQIGAAITIARATIKEKENILTHERSSIARELHDSLAQSLSYLKIEVSRIQNQLSGIEHSEEAQTIATDIRTELNNAYRQLRELLTTFRLSIETDELGNTIKQAIEDFSQREPVKINHDIRLSDCRINPHEAIHLVYILREALTNIHKHANASNVWVEVRCAPSKIITLSIQDDGIGIDKNALRKGHFGLSIMQERTTALNGTYNIANRNGGGTRIEINFTPVEHHEPTGDITSWINQT